MNLNEYLEDLNSGVYPELFHDRKLYSLFLTVVTNNTKQIRIIRYIRPTDVERLVFRYGLKGVSIEAKPSPFNKYELEYYVIINRDAFLANLDIFRNRSCKAIKKKYDKYSALKRAKMQKQEKAAKKSGLPSPFERFILASGKVHHKIVVGTE